MKRLILLLATLGCLQLTSEAQIQGTIKSSPTSSFKITIRNSSAATIAGNFAQYNAAIRIPQTTPTPTLTVSNLLPLGTIVVTSTYTDSVAGYTYYNIFYEAPTALPNPISLAQNVEQDIFAGTFSNGTGSVQVDLVDTKMFTDPSATTFTGTGINQFTQFYVNIDPSGTNGDATNYAVRFYDNAESTPATIAPTTSFVGLAGVPLPITFSHIEATKRDNASVITWGTSFEMNNVGYYIERSNDGKAFTKIGFQNSKATNGNSNSALEYSFTDARPFAGINYYRLKQMDKDGKSVYSKIVSVAFDNAQVVKIYPNPATSMVTVDAAAIKNISLYNVLGQMVNAPVTYGNSSHNINTSALAKGTYTLRIVTDNGTTTQKLILQN
ncbi:MAG: T9SS type A sorting domain-containing protein [Taibaiella sp.]